MREQVCLYMCPWPRIQAALTDEYALNVTYRSDRGEPRMSAKKAAAARLKGEPAGDCVDCNQCVAVCPTGVDIRNGPNLGCIQCGLCIDACDTVMAKLERPTRLIAYDNDINIRRRSEGKPNLIRIVRPRTILYFAVIVLVGGVMLWALGSRQLTAINVLHDRNPEFVRLSDGGVRNAYTIRILNKYSQPRRFTVTIEGVPAARLEVIGAEEHTVPPVVEVGPDQSREMRAVISLDSAPDEVSLPVTFVITDLTSGAIAHNLDNFRGPGGAKENAK
jgi:cytochrome c oxidase accessory protein FixG